MQIDILHLYNQAANGQLSAQELSWLDEQVSQFPYFSLPRTILAKHHHDRKTPERQRKLLASSAYSRNRRLLKSYILDGMVSNPLPVLPAAEKTAAQESEVETVVKESAPVAEQKAAPVEKQEVKKASTNAPVGETHPAPPLSGVKAGRINWFLQTKLNLRVKKYVGGLEKMRTEMAAEVKAQDAPKANAKTTTPKTKQKPAAEEAAKKENYEIGSFSSFTFLDDVDDAEEGEMDSTVSFAPSLTLETPASEEKELSELVIQESGRRLEILVTPEELEKYFKGKLPKPETAATEKDANISRLEFNFQPVDFSIGEEAVAEKEPVQKEAAPHKVERAPEVEQLIERFIENEPTISRVDKYEAPNGDLSKRSAEDDDEWVTETLAKVYAMQGNHSKATKIYKKLALLFPEKSAYFDGLIQKLKK